MEKYKRQKVSPSSPATAPTRARSHDAPVLFFYLGPLFYFFVLFFDSPSHHISNIIHHLSPSPLSNPLTGNTHRRRLSPLFLSSGSRERVFRMRCARVARQGPEQEVCRGEDTNTHRFLLTARASQHTRLFRTREGRRFRHPPPRGAIRSNFISCYFIFSMKEAKEISFAALPSFVDLGKRKRWTYRRCPRVSERRACRRRSC